MISKKQKELLDYMEKNLSADDFRLVMDMYMTPMEELQAAAEKEWAAQDKVEMKQNGEFLKTFKKIKRNYLLNNEISPLATAIIKTLEEKHGNNVHPNTQRALRRYVVGRTTAGREPGNRNTLSPDIK